MQAPKGAFFLAITKPYPLKTYKNLLLCLLVYPILAGAQDDKDDQRYKYQNLLLAYNYSFDPAVGNDYHLLEVGIQRMIYGGRHGGGLAYGLSTEVGLNTDGFLIGPKLGGALYLNAFMIGSELVVYTDLIQTNSRYVPFVGFGGPRFKISIGYQIVISNNDFYPVEKGVLNFSYFLHLKREKTSKIDENNESLPE